MTYRNSLLARTLNWQGIKFTKIKFTHTFPDLQYSDTGSANNYNPQPLFFYVETELTCLNIIIMVKLMGGCLGLCLY